MDILGLAYTNVLLIVFGAALLWLFWPARSAPRRHVRRKNHVQRKALEKMRCGRAFWGVSIRGKQCDAQRPYLGKKFTFERAPALPLAGCSSRRCRCRYQGLVERRHTQRRSGVDRRHKVRLDANHPDHRSGRERRRSATLWKGRAGDIGGLSPGLE